MNTRVIIDPACNFYYSSFFIKGLMEIYGRNVSFRSSPFRDLRYSSDTHILSLIFIEENHQKKVIIDFSDAPDIDIKFLEWCDVYGKINYREYIVAGNNKITPAAPNYAVKIWNKPMAGLTGLFNYLKSFDRTIPFHPFIAKYLMTAKRVSNFKDFEIPVQPGYIFFVSTWWETQHLTNRCRASFIRACRSIPTIRFEGGLIPENLKTSSPEYEDVFIRTNMPYNQYLEKTKKSMVVFNTPAYHLCHGWKLAEFLGMGKAIISTPLINDLPAPLTHGENIYFVSEEIESVRRAIIEITEDSVLRNRLEKGALAYYNKYIEPRSAIERILQK
jgi:glycosyltransferase involved in cell wall biosynthesis